MNGERMPIIAADHITKTFGSTQAVQDISFELRAGEIMGYLGPNGAGKTTTIRMILDILKPDSGTIAVLGGGMNEEKKNLIGYLPEERGLYQDITLEKCLTYLALIKGMEKKDITQRLDELLERFDLSEHRKAKVKSLSKGMQQKAQLISTFIHRPKLVIVDEPFSALDPLNTRTVKQLLFEERSRGTAIMMSTHQMNQAEEMCERIILIDKGKIILSGMLEDVRRQFSKNELIVKARNWIPEDFPGVLNITMENQHLRITIQEGIDPNRILSEMIKRDIEIEHFAVAVPTLNEIFINVIEGASVN
jgi:ABC-2 type transport system ATP-binding protein